MSVAGFEVVHVYGRAANWCLYTQSYIYPVSRPSSSKVAPVVSSYPSRSFVLHYCLSSKYPVQIT